MVGALQETKWFGSTVYEVNDGVILTSGRTGRCLEAWLWYLEAWL